MRMILISIFKLFNWPLKAPGSLFKSWTFSNTLPPKSKVLHLVLFIFQLALKERNVYNFRWLINIVLSQRKTISLRDKCIL